MKKAALGLTRPIQLLMWMVGCAYLCAWFQHLTLLIDGPIRHALDVSIGKYVSLLLGAVVGLLIHIAILQLKRKRPKLECPLE